MVVIIDTNVLRADFLFKSEKHTQFLNALKRTKTTLIVPQIVMEEANHLFELEKLKRKKELEKSFDFLAKLYIETLLMPDWPSIFQENLAYSELLEKLFPSCCDYWSFDTIDYKNSFLPELVKRAINKTKPFSENGQEFRDAILWMSIIELIKDIKDKQIEDEFVFITFNKKDFGDANSGELNPALKRELETFGLQLDVFFSIDAFMIEHMNYTIQFTEQWLISHLDWVRINAEVEKAVNEIHCGYYFTLFERSCSEYLDYYEVASVNNNRDDIFYYAFQKADNTVLLELHFSGDVSINFYTESGNIISIITSFSTQTDVRATANEIFFYSGEYFEEESVIALPPFIQPASALTVMET